MKLSLSRRGARRSNERKSTNNPVKKQSLAALNLLERHLLKYMAEQKRNKHPGAKSIPLEAVNLYTGTIISNAKDSRTMLKAANEIKAFDFLITEMEKTLAVLGASCKQYCNDYGTEAVPDVVLKQFVGDLRIKILQ